MWKNCLFFHCPNRNGRKSAVSFVQIGQGTNDIDLESWVIGIRVVGLKCYFFLEGPPPLWVWRSGKTCGMWKLCSPATKKGAKGSKRKKWWGGNHNSSVEYLIIRNLWQIAPKPLIRIGLNTSITFPKLACHLAYTSIKLIL